MRRIEKRLNDFPQFRTESERLSIHLIYVRSPHANALPIILTNGWPGSVLEFLDVIAPLTDPTAHGEKAEDAFHVVLPSLLGYGFSDKPVERDWGLPRIARAWGTLMDRLGYGRYVAQGGEWEAGVTTWMAKQQVKGLVGIQVNLPNLFPPPIVGAERTGESAARGHARRERRPIGMCEAAEHPTRDARLRSCRLARGKAAWIYGEFGEWSKAKSQPERVLFRNQMLDNIMVNWLTNTAASSTWLYTESFT